MKRTEAKSVGNIIRELLQETNLEDEFDEQTASASWESVVGPGINKYTSSRYVKNGVLYVTITSSSLRNELMLYRSKLIDRLNESVGRRVIHDIVFR